MLRPDSRLWPSLTGFRDHTHWTHHYGLDSFGRHIRPMQKHLPDNTQHSQQTFMLPAGFEPIIPASERPQTHALDRAATGIGLKYTRLIKSMSNNTRVKKEQWSCGASVTRRQNCSSACITNRLDDGCQGSRYRSTDFETKNNSNAFWPPANNWTQYMAMYYSHSPNPPVC